MRLLPFCLLFSAATFAAVALTNEDIIRMVQQGIAPGTILASIKSAETAAFHITPEAQPALVAAGVSPAIIEAMVRRVIADEARSSDPGVAPTNSQAAPRTRNPPRGIETSVTIPTTEHQAKANDAITVTSIPEGATVEWNRKVIGRTPLTYKVGEYAFNARKVTVFSKRLMQPVVLRVSKEGYVAKEATITKEMIWRSLNGANRFAFYIVTTNNWQIDLDQIGAVRTALTNADIVKLKTADFGDELIIDRINNTPAAFRLGLTDLVELRKAGISDAVIQAMLHAK